VSSRNVEIEDEDGAGITVANFLKRQKEAKNGLEAAAVRWAVALSDCA